MGDNGHFTKYSPGSGFSAMVYRGGKGDYTEGGVRVDAFVRWPGMIEADSIAAGIVHVTERCGFWFFIKTRAGILPQTYSLYTKETMSAHDSFQDQIIISSRTSHKYDNEAAREN